MGTLRDVTIPVGWSVPANMFSGCTSLEVVHNLAYATSIGENAFAGCHKLSNNALLSCSSIGDYAFRGCDNLKEVTLSTETFGIGIQCFAGCSSLKKIYNLGVIRSTNIASQFLSGVNLEHNTIGVSAGCLASDALGGCTMPEWNLPNIYMTEAITSNYFGASDGVTLKCKDGTIYTQPSDTTVWFDDGTCNTIVASSSSTLMRQDFFAAGLMTSEYEWKKQPTKVALGTRVFALEGLLFSGCHKLSAVVMNGGINRIEVAVFDGCTAL